MVEIELAGHWTGQLEWLPTDRFAKTAPAWTAPEMLGRALSAGTRPNFMHMCSVVPQKYTHSNFLELGGSSAVSS